MELFARGKLNLTLDVLGKRADGYHDLRMIMQTVALADRLTVAEEGTGIHVSSNLSYLPCDGRNLAARAAEAYFAAAGREAPGLAISIEKVLPVCAGVAGGSSDAAAVLRGLQEKYNLLSKDALQAAATEIGSDVPYCLAGGTMLAEGRGEVLTSLPPMPETVVVICKPRFFVRTPMLFAAIDAAKLRCHPDTAGALEALEAGDVARLARRMYNVFEDVMPAPRAAVIAAIKKTLIDGGALGAAMSGTGPTVFGLFADAAPANKTAARLRREYRDVFVSKTV
ncbi:MAG TPA: 4-(cytidine 5'-diphospho)-2-C-methyl-D-erythritol kinase [Oscillospiraceae bacterium]|nr:4-(cytidine 5'-diphospho)-2-C-methyl-D-erythritol kinase [Oscillospiraceae bacterium]